MSGRLSAKLCSMVERCEYSTPLGLPVVPEVKHSELAVRSSNSGQLELSFCASISVS